MFDQLKAKKFAIDFQSHAGAILQVDFPDIAAQLEEVLLASSIPIEEIIQSGGGEAKGTQRLRNALKNKSWTKHKFTILRVVDGKEREAESHEIDHIRKFDKGTVALEIEWNNKDAFFDRDLDNFKRLHAEGAISLGIIVTRSADLQSEMKGFIRRFADENLVDSYKDVDRIGLDPTRPQKKAIDRRVNKKKNPLPFREAWVEVFFNNKFGTATTHWNKLQERLSRGVGNPCPLVLIGLPSSIVTFGENPNEVKKLLDQAAQEVEETAEDDEPFKA